MRHFLVLRSLFLAIDELFLAVFLD